LILSDTPCSARRRAPAPQRAICASSPAMRSSSRARLASVARSFCSASLRRTCRPGDARGLLRASAGARRAWRR
jgi:hypothetical protein